MFLLGTVLVFLAQLATNNNDFERSNQILSQIPIIKSNQAQISYLKAVNHFSLNEKKEALTWILNIENSFLPVPERYKTICFLMKNDIEAWDSHELNSPARKMRLSKDRLAKAEGGLKTQKIQKEILDELDKQIKDKEDELSGAAAKAEMERLKESDKLGKGNQPAPDSIPNGGDPGKGTLDDKKIKALAESWGKMPEKERAKAMQELLKDYPARYKLLIEEYNKALGRREQP